MGEKQKMMVVPKLFVRLALSTILVCLPAPSTACTIEIHGDGSPRSEMRRSKAVFLGEVLDVRQATQEERQEYSNFYIARVRVTRYWKGIKSAEVKVETDMVGCGPNLRTGSIYLFYAVGKRWDLTGTRTRRLENADEDLKALGHGKPLGPKQVG